MVRIFQRRKARSARRSRGRAGVRMVAFALVLAAVAIPAPAAAGRPCVITVTLDTITFFADNEPGADEYTFHVVVNGIVTMVPPPPGQIVVPAGLPADRPFVVGVGQVVYDAMLGDKDAPPPPISIAYTATEHDGLGEVPPNEVVPSPLVVVTPASCSGVHVVTVPATLPGPEPVDVDLQFTIVLC